MKTMSNKVFWRNYKNLPMAAKVLWSISFIMAIMAMTMMILEFADVIVGSLKVELILINLSLWTNIFLMNKYGDYREKTELTDVQNDRQRGRNKKIRGSAKPGMKTEA